jgi:hypothetical protein
MKQAALDLILMATGALCLLLVLLCHPTIRRISIAWHTYKHFRDEPDFTDAESRQWLRTGGERTFKTMTGEVDLYGNVTSDQRADASE